MTDAISHRRYEAVKDAAHALRGGAASVGAVQLTQLAGRLEKAGHDALRVKAAQWIEELQQTSRRALAELDQYIADPQFNQASPKTGHTGGNVTILRDAYGEALALTDEYQAIATPSRRCARQRNSGR